MTTSVTPSLALGTCLSVICLLVCACVTDNRGVEEWCWFSLLLTAMETVGAMNSEFFVWIFVFPSTRRKI